MDWPKFDFCVLLWVLCVSKASGDSTALISSKESKCEWGDILPRKDECNTCICFEGDVHCTNLPCRARQRTDDQPECQEGQPVIKLDECNECFCFDGKLDCSDLICIRGSKCTEGQNIPRPDHCNICKCFEGHIVCTNYECNPRSKRRPSLAENATTDGEIVKECEADDYIPPPPPPFDCNKCLCINQQVFCTMDNCNDDLPDINTRFNLQNEPNNNLEVYDKKISVDPYLSLFYKNFDKTPTKLVHTHAYNGFHQEIKVHSKNLSQDTSKLIKALASSLDNPVLGQIGDKIKSSSSNFNNHEPKKISGGQALQNYIPNSPYSKELAMGKHSPNLSDINPLHSLSSLITSGSQSNETILVIPSKQKTFVANQQPHLITPYSSESADHSFEQNNPYYSANHPSNIPPSEHFKTFDNPPSSSRNKDLINQSPIPVLPMNSEANNESIQLSAPYSQEDEPVSLSNAYKLNQVQHPDNFNKYSNTSTSHPVYNPSQDQLKMPLNVNEAQYSQPHSQLGPNAASYRPYPNEPLQNGLQPIQNNHYPTSNIQYNPISSSQSQFDQNNTNSFGNQNILSDQDGNYPRHPYKLNPINYNHHQKNSSLNEFNPDQAKPVFDSDNRGHQYSPLYASVEPNPGVYNTQQLNAPHHGLQPDQREYKPHSINPTQDNNPTQMRLHEKEVLSTHDRNPYLPPSKFEPNPSLYKMHPSNEPEHGFVHNQVSNKPYMTGYDVDQNGHKPEQDKNSIILDDRSPHNQPYPQFVPKPIYNHNELFTPPQNGYQFDHNKQQPHSPFEPNQTQTNPNIYQTNYPNSPENIHKPGQGEQHTQHYNTHLQKNNLPQTSMGPNQEERLSSLDNKGNRYNVTNSHYKTHSSSTYVTQYAPSHQGITSDLSPATSNENNSFDLHHPSPNSIELNGRGKRPDNIDNIPQMNATKLEFLPIQRGNELDPTIVKVYEYLNQPNIYNYPPKQNENDPHASVTKTYPGLHPESLQYPSRSSMSVEDDKNGISYSEYPTRLDSQPSLWGSGYRDKDKNPIRYPNHYDVSPLLYSGQYDKNKVPVNNSSYGHNILEEFPVNSRYKSPSFQRGKYDKNIVPINKSLYAHDVPEESPSYTTPSFQRGQYDKNKVPINKSSYAHNVPEEAPSYTTPSFQIGQYDKNKVPINKSSYVHNVPEEVPVHSPYTTPLFQIGQYDKNKVPINKGSYSHNVPENFPVLSTNKTPSFQTGQYDKNKVPISYSPYSHYNILQPEASPVNSRNKSPLFNNAQYDEKKDPISYNQYAKNISRPEASPVISQKKSPFYAVQYDKNKLPINYDPYAHNISQPEVPLNSFHNNSSLWKSGYYDKNKVPINYDRYAHNISQPEASPVSSHNKSPLFPTVQYDNNKVPINYDPYAHNISQPEAYPVSLHNKSPLFHTAQYDNNKVPINYDPYAHNISQPEAYPVSLHNKSPLFHTVKYDSNKVPINYDPYAYNISQPEAYPVSSHNKSPLFNTIQYDNNKIPINYDPYPHKISQPEASPISSHNELPLLHNVQYDNNKVPINYDPHARNISQPEVSPYNSQKKSPLFYTEHYDQNKVPINYDPRAHNISPAEPSLSNSRYPPYLTSFPDDGTGVPTNEHGLTNHDPKEQHIYEQIRIDDIKLPETLTSSLYNPSPTSTSEQYENNKIPINEHKNNPHYDLNLNDIISTLDPLNPNDQQDQSVDYIPSQQQPETKKLDGLQYIPNSAEDPNSSINKPNKSETNLQQQPDASFVDERGSLDGFQYKSTLDEDSDGPKANLNKHKPTKELLDDNESLSVIPHKQNYAKYSSYPKQNNDPRLQFKYTQNSPYSVNHPGSQEENKLKFAIDPKIPQNNEDQTAFKSIPPQESGPFDDRGANDGFQYISNSDEDSQNKPDHNQFKPTSVDKLDNRYYPPSLSENDKNSLGPGPESTAYPGNDNSIIIDVDSINPDILKLLQNANKPLSIEDLINEIDSHKQPQLKPNDDSSIPNDLSDDNDQLQPRFNDLFPDIASYPQIQKNKKNYAPPPIDDSEFSIGELDPLELLRLLFPIKFHQAPGKQNDPVPLSEKDLLSLLLSTQNIYNLPKSKKPSTKEKHSDKLPKYDDIPDDSPKNAKKKNKPTPQEYPVPGQSLNNVDPRSKEKNVIDFLPQQHQTTIQQPSALGQDQDQPQYKQVSKVSDESRNFPPIQYPDVHIILHQRNVGDDNALPQYLETDVDGNDFYQSILHSRMKRPKEQKEECGESSNWVRNCHACSCHGGQASCYKIPDCVLRLLEEPMMCKPYSNFKMGSCYSCECNGDGIPECDASECKIESINKDSDEDSDEIKPPVYHEFFEDSKAKEMLSYYTFFKKLPKDISDAANYPTCEPGTHWVSSCHNCECKDNHKHECTKIEDCVLDLESLGKPGKCKPNSQFYPKSTNVACQRCSCDDEGNPSCPIADRKKQ